VDGNRLLMRPEGVSAPVLVGVVGGLITIRLQAGVLVGGLTREVSPSKIDTFTSVFISSYPSFKIESVSSSESDKSLLAFWWSANSESPAESEVSTSITSPAIF